MSIMLSICEFRVRPDLIEVSYVTILLSFDEMELLLCD